MGTIVQDPNTESMYSNFSEKARVLVRFDDDLFSFGLECHNSVKISLWILETDLTEI